MHPSGANRMRRALSTGVVSCASRELPPARALGCWRRRRYFLFLLQKRDTKTHSSRADAKVLGGSGAAQFSGSAFSSSELHVILLLTKTRASINSIYPGPFSGGIRTRYIGKEARRFFVSPAPLKAADDQSLLQAACLPACLPALLSTPPPHSLGSCSSSKRSIRLESAEGHQQQNKTAAGILLKSRNRLKRKHLPVSIA